VLTPSTATPSSSRCAPCGPCGVTSVPLPVSVGSEGMSLRLTKGMFRFSKKEALIHRLKLLSYNDKFNLLSSGRLIYKYNLYLNNIYKVCVVIPRGLRGRGVRSAVGACPPFASG